MLNENVGELSVFREYSLFGLLVKSEIYANNKLLTKVANGCQITCPLPLGAYDIDARNPLMPFLFKKRKLLYSNKVSVRITREERCYLNLRPHPLYFWGRHHPDATRPFKPVECLLLLKQDEHFEEHIKQLDEIGNQVTTEIKQFSYHPLTLFLAIVLGLFALVSSIWQPDLYAAGDGIPWGFLFGLSCMIGLLNGRSKQLLAQGWEHKFLVYTAIGAGFIFFFIPTGFLWQRMLYFLFVVGTLLWARACYYRWKKNKVGLDELERKEWEFEQTL